VAVASRRSTCQFHLHRLVILSRDSGSPVNWFLFSLIFESLLGVLHSLPWAKNTLWAHPCLSVCLSRFSTDIGSLYDWGGGCHCCSTMGWGCWYLLLCNNSTQEFPLLCNTGTSSHFVQERPKVTVGICARMTLDHINATTTYMMWCEEHLWNVSVLQRVHLSNLIFCFVTHFLHSFLIVTFFCRVQTRPCGLFQFRIKFWNSESFRHLVGLFGWGIGSKQGIYLHRTTQHRKMWTNICASSGIQTHDSNAGAVQNHACLRPHTLCLTIVKLGNNTFLHNSCILFLWLKGTSMKNVGTSKESSRYTEHEEQTGKYVRWQSFSVVCYISHDLGQTEQEKADSSSRSTVFVWI
jgi:hypothetical protein